VWRRFIAKAICLVEIGFRLEGLNQPIAKSPGRIPVDRLPWYDNGHNRTTLRGARYVETASHKQRSLAHSRQAKMSRFAASQDVLVNTAPVIPDREVEASLVF
jgi:hypothetical protein